MCCTSSALETLGLPNPLPFRPEGDTTLTRWASCSSSRTCIKQCHGADRSRGRQASAGGNLKGAGWRPQRRLSRRRRRVALGLRVVINRAMAIVTRLFHQPSHNKPHSTPSPSSAAHSFSFQASSSAREPALHKPRGTPPWRDLRGRGPASYHGVDSAFQVYDPAW